MANRSRRVSQNLSLRSWSPYHQPKRMRILVTLQLRVTITTTGTTTTNTTAWQNNTKKRDREINIPCILRRSSSTAIKSGYKDSASSVSPSLMRRSRARNTLLLYFDEKKSRRGTKIYHFLEMKLLLYVTISQSKC